VQGVTGQQLQNLTLWDAVERGTSHTKKHVIKAEHVLPKAWSFKKIVSLRGGTGKSLARPTSRCRRTESWKTAGFRINQ
jgi:hypothetical protein